MTRLIDAEELKKAIETYDKFSCLPDCKLEPFRNLEHPEMFEPYVHLRDILNAIDKAPTVIPEEMKPLIEKTIEILPQLTDAIVENLPRILDDIDICQECEYRKTSFKEADND